MNPLTGARFRASVAAMLLGLFGTAAQALSGGTLAASGAFGHVGSVNGASGVLIAPNWVLTAGHVGSAGGSFASELGNASFAEKFTPASRMIPDFPGVRDNDIALLFLGQSLGTDTLFPRLNSTVLDADTLRFPIDATLTSGKSGTTTRPAVGAVGIVGLVDTYPSSNGPNYTTNWLITGPSVYVEGGDSGGGLFLGEVSGSAGSTLLGVSSVSLSFGSDKLSGAVQLSPYFGWINTVIASRTIGQSAQSAQWVAVTPVPEPATAAMLLLGLGLILQTRRQPGRSAA